MHRRILITGGATGIGQATALLAAQKGYVVAINFVHSDQAARDLVSQIEAMGQVAIAIKADIAEEEEVVRMFETMDRELGPINALVNNAAHMNQQMRLHEMSTDRPQPIACRINRKSAFRDSSRFCREMNLKLKNSPTRAASRINSGNLIRPRRFIEGPFSS